MNFIPVLGKTFISSIGKLLTNLFNEIYNQKISSGRVTRVIVSFLLLLGVVTIVYSGVSTLRDFDKVVEKPIINKEEIIKKPKEEKKIPKKRK